MASHRKHGHVHGSDAEVPIQVTESDYGKHDWSRARGARGDSTSSRCRPVWSTRFGRVEHNAAKRPVSAHNSWKHRFITMQHDGYPMLSSNEHSVSTYLSGLSPRSESPLLGWSCCDFDDCSPWYTAVTDEESDELLEISKWLENTPDLNNHGHNEEKEDGTLMQQSRRAAPAPDHFSSSIFGNPDIVNTKQATKTTLLVTNNGTKQAQVVSRVKKSRKVRSQSDKTASKLRGQQMRAIMLKHGTHHVYFGRGEPLRDNPGNIRYRRIVDQYYEELRVNNVKKERKAEIRKEIEEKVRKGVNGQSVKFFCFVKKHSNMTGLKGAPKAVIDNRIGHALRDTPKRRGTKTIVF